MTRAAGAEVTTAAEGGPNGPAARPVRPNSVVSKGIRQDVSGSEGRQ